ncbi:MAG TPA: metallophosphoesterase family protein [Baekduia sp.]
MRILALYDVHGNLEAVEAVLGDPRAAGADVVVVGGDVVPGPFAVEVLDRLEGLDVPTRWLRGNGEREVAEVAAARVEPEHDPADMAVVTAILNARTLGPERAGALGALPMTVEVDGVLFCHATPTSDVEILTRVSAPERYAAALAGVAGSSLVVAGHTHQQDDRVVGGVTRFVNAGSVGLPYEGDGAARWLWIEDGEPVLLSTAYDHAGAGARILASGWPDRDSTGAAMTELVEASVITELFEGRAAAVGRGG